MDIIRHAAKFGNRPDGFFRANGRYYPRGQRSELQMCKSPFLWGMAAGIMVGVTAEMIVCPRPKCRKTAVGQAMQRMGNALDTVMVTVAKKLD